MGLDVSQGLLDRAQGAQGEEIDFDQAGILDPILVPLHHHATRHRRSLQGYDLDKGCGGDEHAPDVNG